MAVAEEGKVAERSTGDIFAYRSGRFGRENPEEFVILQEELYEWGSTVVASGLTRGENREDILTSHIDSVLAKRTEEGRQTSAEDFVEEIFSQEPDETISAEEIMSRLRKG